MNDFLKWILSIGGIISLLIILFIIYLVVFVYIRPFMGEITEDRPIMKVLCEMQAVCGSALVSHDCGLIGTNPKKTSLLKVKNYYGCNESTSTYFEMAGYGYVEIETCSCGGLM